MPTYEYLCKKCGRFEELQSMSEEPLKTCPTCGGPVKRLISSNVNIIFKGSGFYTTDHRSKEYKESMKADDGGGSSSSLKETAASSHSS
ncbi:MAG: zinc ribbon domain-containing protein [Firmicutes bacterium]|nr:zinc ribbon domain-containing protein [Bacillota bacterium]